MSAPQDQSFFPSRRQLPAFLGYVAAAALYVLIGIFVPNFLLSFPVAVAYVLVVAWIVPEVIRSTIRRLLD